MTERRWADSEAAATQTVKEGMAAFNAGDDEALFDTFHVPHVRISGTGAVAVYATRGDLDENYRREFAARAGVPRITRSWIGPRRSIARKTKSTCPSSGRATTRTAVR